MQSEIISKADKRLPLASICKYKKGHPWRRAWLPADICRVLSNQLNWLACQKQKSPANYRGLYQPGFICHAHCITALAIHLMGHIFRFVLPDHLWWTTYEYPPDKPRRRIFRHPHLDAPRCVPCGYPHNTSGLEFKLPQGCPCTPQVLCDADPEQSRFGVLLLALLDTAPDLPL